MVRVAVALFLMAHGFVHLVIYATPKDPAKREPFAADHSWLLSASGIAVEPTRRISVVAASLVGGLSVLAGLFLLLDLGWWTVWALLGAALGLALKTLYFNPWLSLGVTLDVGIVLAIAAGWPSSLY
jgi:hypothetical protein